MATPSTPTNVYGGVGPVVLGVSWTFFIVATVLLCMRYYVRFAMNRPAKWPMIWLTASYTLGVLAQIFVTVDAKLYGVGNHIDVVLAAGVLVPCVLWVWITLFFALGCIALGKAAAASLLISIQGNTRPLGRAFLIALGTLNVVIDGVTMVVLWFQCTPVKKLWNSELQGTCSHLRTVEYLGIAAGSVNAASDVIFGLYPIFLIWNLNMPKRLKFGLGVLMGCGVFSGVCAAIKTSKLPEMIVTEDPTYAIAGLVIWGLVEQWIVVIVSTIPPSWPLIHCLLQGRNPLTGLTSDHQVSDSRGKPVYLSGGHDYSNLRGGDTKTFKSKGYVDHNAIPITEGSTGALPDNIIMMRQDITVRTDTASITDRGYAASHSSDDEGVHLR